MSALCRWLGHKWLTGRRLTFINANGEWGIAGRCGRCGFANYPMDGAE